MTASNSPKWFTPERTIMLCIAAAATLVTMGDGFNFRETAAVIILFALALLISFQRDAYIGEEQD